MDAHIVLKSPTILPIFTPIYFPLKHQYLLVVTKEKSNVILIQGMSLFPTNPSKIKLRVALFIGFDPSERRSATEISGPNKYLQDLGIPPAKAQPRDPSEISSLTLYIP